MTEANIRDYETDDVVGRVTDEGIETDDETLQVVTEGFEDGVTMLWPGDEPGEYREFIVEPGDEGYVRAVIDELPSPFFMDEEERHGDLPVYAPDELREASEGGQEASEEESKGISQLSAEMAEKAADALSKEGVSSGTAGAGSATYGGHQDDEEEDEETEKSEPPFEEVDDAFMKMYENVVWWALGEDDPDLSKAPNMWEGSGQVPEFVEKFIEEAIKADAFWQGKFENLPATAAQRLQDIFEDKMTQPQGWSLGSLTEDLLNAFPSLDKDAAILIARNETAALANKGREIAYEERDDVEEHTFYWTGPQDFRTTDICEYIKERSHPKHGGEPKSMSELKDLLQEAIDANPDFAGATPDRVEEWMPHYQCRHTFVRSVDL